MSLFRNENPILGANAKVRDTASGKDAKLLQREYISTEIGTVVSNWFWVAPYACQVVAVKEVHSVVGGAAAAISPRKITVNGTAPNAAAGANVKELVSAAISLTSTVNTVQTGSLSSTVSDLQLAVGDRLAYNITGTIGTPTGYLQVELIRI